MLRSPLSDVAVVVATMSVAGVPILLYRRHDVLGASGWTGRTWLVVLGLSVTGCLALALRRRWPVTVLACCCVTMLAGTSVPESSKFTSVPMLVALYTVAAHRGPRVWLAAGLGAAAAKMGAELKHGGFVSVLGGLIWVVAPMAVGLAVANRRGYVAAVEGRAARAESTKEEEARRRVAEERIRIARELHDVLAHSMAVISVQSGMAAHLIHRQPHRAERALWHINEASHAALAELRTTICLLRDSDESPGPHRPLPDLGQLDDLVAQVRAAGLTVHTHVAGDLAGVPADVGLVSYRVLQEELTNVLKHARARTVEVTADLDERRLCLDVRDDGAGLRGLPPGEGHGRIGMRERVQALGGAFHDGPAEHGYRVHAVIPLAQAT